MKLRGLVVRPNHIFYSCLATALLVAVGMTPAYAQQSIVTDWSSHHVKFSSPGSEMDALMNGHRQGWQNYVSNPRYQWQQNKRNAARANRLSTHTPDFWDSRENREPNSKNNSLQGLWTSKLGPVGDGTLQGAFPAEYDANFSSPSCTGDYIAFPVNATGSSSQANLVVYNHLYVNAAGTGFCPTLTTPDTFAAYYVYLDELGTNVLHVEGSPVTSENGTQIAFVVNDSTFDYVRFYVLTLAAGGTEGAPTELTDAGTAAGAENNGTASANGKSYNVTLLSQSDEALTSPWVDYTHNVAYIASSGGKIYKIQNVFGSTAASEVTTSPWPITVASGEALTAPVVDPQTGDILVGASNGDLYCVTSAGVSCGAGSKGSFTVATAVTHTGGTAGAVNDAPVVTDNGVTTGTGTTGWVFSQAVYTTATTTDGATGPPATRGTAAADAYVVVAQAPITSTGLGTAVGVSGGTVAVTATYATTGDHAPAITLNTPTLYSGDFSNAYYNSSGSTYSGYMYFCGYETATDANGYPPGADTVTYNPIPQLYRIGFTANGTMTGTPTAIYTLASNAPATQASGCAPLTEFYNANANSGAGVDYLFAGVSGYGHPTACGGDGCIMNFELPSNGTAPTTPTAAYSLTGNGDGSSGIVIDNQSTDAGASQIYFSNLQTGNATAASQASLQ